MERQVAKETRDAPIRLSRADIISKKASSVVNPFKTISIYNISILCCFKRWNKQLFKVLVEKHVIYSSKYQTGTVYGISVDKFQTILSRSGGKQAAMKDWFGCFFLSRHKSTNNPIIIS